MFINSQNMHMAEFDPVFSGWVAAQYKNIPCSGIIWDWCAMHCMF